MHATKENYLHTVFIKLLLSEARLKPIKIMSPYSPTYGEFKNLRFVSVAPTVCMSHAFVCDLVDLKTRLL